MVTLCYLCLSFPKKTKNHIKREADYTSSDHGRGQLPSKLICRSPSVDNDQTAHISLQIPSISKSAETKTLVAPFLVWRARRSICLCFFPSRAFRPAGEGGSTDSAAPPQEVFSKNFIFFATPYFPPRFGALAAKNNKTRPVFVTRLVCQTARLTERRLIHRTGGHVAQ